MNVQPAQAMPRLGPDVEARVRDVLAATIELQGDEAPERITRDLCPGWTSLRHLVMMTTLEDTFQTTLTMDEMVSMTSLEAILQVLATHVGEPPAGVAAAVPADRLEVPAVAQLDMVHAGHRPRQAPRPTVAKVLRWLNGVWQLRGRRRIGRWVRVRGRLHVRNDGELVIGDRVQLHSHFARTVLVTTGGGRLEIGEGSTVNYGSDICATGLVRIGRDCMLGTHTIILDNDFHDLGDRYRRPEPRPVILGDGVWLGNRVTVLPGVTIGTGTVVAAGSVVASDLPAGTVAAGNPARVIQKLR